MKIMKYSYQSQADNYKRMILKQLNITGNSWQKDRVQNLSIVFPEMELEGRQFGDLSELNRLLRNQAEKYPRLTGCHKWMRIHDSQGSNSFYRCRIASCQAFIKIKFQRKNITPTSPEQEQIPLFVVTEFNNIHEHSNEGIVQIFRQHHIAGKFLQKFRLSSSSVSTQSSSSSSVSTQSDSMFTLKIDFSCKSNPGTAAIAYQLLNQDRKVVIQTAREIGQFTTNQSEFIALLWGLLECLNINTPKLEVKSKSQLLINCMNRRNNIQSINLSEIIQSIRIVEARMRFCKISYLYCPKTQMGTKLQSMCWDILGIKKKKYF